ncbi:MAG: TonB-dependent receptor [Nitrospirae bacterium]|nr:TonB-dependent receptor [Nitrospirota bacterium]
MKIRIFFVFLFTALIYSLPAVAGPPPPTASDPDENLLYSATVEDLLVFWEEKDLYVVTATRHFKPISQAAENISVVTAKDIEDMNAHTVAEVLSRVTGMFLDFQGQDFGSAALLYIQQTADRSSPQRHVLVLLDGIPMNNHNGGQANTDTIPMGIIDRIEIIKGPASSAWGSSLGGVINIITKKAGDTDASHGSVSVSYGERNSQDYRAEMYGKAADAGYYIFAGHKDSDGLRDRRYSQDNNFYTKLSVPVSSAIDMGVTFGYSGREFKDNDFPGSDFSSMGEDSRAYGTVFLNAHVMERLDLKLSFYSQKEKFDQMSIGLGLGTFGPEGTFVRNSIWIDTTKGGSGSLVYTGEVHKIVVGTDIIHGTLDQKIINGDFFQQVFFAPEAIRTQPDIDKWAVYVNDTITLGKLSVTPGVRYDRNSETGSFTSPSLGATYKLAEKTLLRASAARGFTIPPLSFTSGGGWFLDPNPELKPEKVWSYQGGIETAATDYVWLKAVVFHHDMKDAIDKDLFVGPPPTLNDKFINIGKTRRTGYELEAETAPLYNTSLIAGFSSVRIERIEEDERFTPIDVNEYTDIYQYNLGVKYDDRKSLTAQLFGRYVWWDLPVDPILGEAKYNNFIWDLNVSKGIYTAQKTKAEVFFTAHNIFSSSHYTFVETKNPQRWVEAGVRLKF